MDHKNSITVGRYLISPVTHLLENGWYASAVVIRSGSGRSAQQRMLRLTRLFQTRMAALRYATAEGLQWIGHRGSSVQPAATGAI
ncbi:MAG: hypothetical protein NDJ19_04490 [Ramlibacter sp.]|nr:hypothetical protein [Ramlibacter sp.]